MHEGIILCLLDEVVEQLRLHGNGDNRLHGCGGGGQGSLREIHSALSASLTIAHTKDESEAEGESLDNELTTMFTLNP